MCVCGAAFYQDVEIKISIHFQPLCLRLFATGERSCHSERVSEESPFQNEMGLVPGIGLKDR